MASDRTQESRGDRPHASSVFVSIVVKPFRMETVLQALGAFRIASMTAGPVRGYGRQKGHLELYRGKEYAISFIPKVKIDIVVEREDLEDVIAAVERAGRTGRIGDGKIFVIDLEGTVIEA